MIAASIVAVVALVVGLIALAGDDGGDGDAGGATTPATATVLPPTTVASETTAEATTTTETTTTTTAPGEVLLAAVNTPIPDPFTENVATEPEEEPTASLPEMPVASTSTTPPAGAVAVPAVRGNQPGLYGGTRNRASCNAEQLVAFLEANPAKAAAWAGVHGIAPSQIREYVAGLTPVILTRDTRVTMYGFRDGRATPKQSILQAGSAVFVDKFGVPRAKCSCGNPLGPPVVVSGPPTYVGPRWPTFQPATVIVVVVNVEVNIFVIVDVRTGEPFGRPVGARGGDDEVIMVDRYCDFFPERPECQQPTTTLPPTTTTIDPSWLIGTRWFVESTCSDCVPHEIEFATSGVLLTDHPNDTTVGNDTWRVEGDQLVWCYNDCYSTHTGTLDENFISGTAGNIVGESWTFTMERLS